eukprot:SAG22_NODE_584_length_8876_cov_42.811667_9_plen_81_part_00
MTHSGVSELIAAANKWIHTQKHALLRRPRAHKTPTKAMEKADEPERSRPSSNLKPSLAIAARHYMYMLQYMIVGTCKGIA